MQTTQSISEDRIDELLECIYASGDPIVKEVYSEFDSAPKTFLTMQSLQSDIDSNLNPKRKFFHYAIYYPEAKGFILEKRIELKPGVVKNHIHRFTQEGWGLIQLRITFKTPGVVECYVAANSEIRANNWAETLNRLGAPELWDWDVVKHHAGRLIRLVRKLSRQAEHQHSVSA